MSGGLILGIILGTAAGWAWKRTHRTWQDWRRAVAAVAALRRLFWRHGFKSMLLAGLLVLVVVLVHP